MKRRNNIWEMLVIICIDYLGKIIRLLYTNLFYITTYDHFTCIHCHKISKVT